MEKIKIKLIRPTSKLPTYGSDHAAGADIYADIEHDIEISPHHTVMIPSGFAIEIPEGYAGFVYPRSGMASKRGLASANKVGVIDSDYRGHIIVPLRNDSNEVQTVDPHERIAQIIFQRYEFLEPVIVSQLSETKRGAGGFGSSGRGDEHGFV